MHLKNTDGTKFDLRIIGYEFPHLENKMYDSDWLNITIHAVHHRGAWSATAACLLTFEVAKLIKWLREIADTDTVQSRLDFTEPKIHFAWIGEDVKSLKIFLSHSLRPSWSPYKGENRERELFLQFAPSPDELRQAAHSLNEQLHPFPTRAHYY